MSKKHPQIDTDEDDNASPYANTSAASDTITLSIQQTVNLLEPDARVSLGEETTNEQMAAIEQSAKLMSARLGGIVRVYSNVDTGVAAQPPQPSAKSAGSNAGTDDEGDEDGGPEEEDAGQYILQPLVFFEQHAKSVLAPDSISMGHVSKLGGFPKTSLLFSGPSPLLDKKIKDHAQQQAAFGAAIGRIGHRVLIGPAGMLGGIVTYPGVCAGDVAPDKAPLITAAEFDSSEISSEITKARVDACAAVYLTWAMNMDFPITRLGEVQVVRISLAQYIDLLGRQSEQFENGRVAQQARGGDAIAQHKYNAIRGEIDARINIAKSYMPGRQKPATTGVLATPRATDPTKLILTMYAYRTFNIEAMDRAKLFDAINPEKTKANDPAKKVLKNKQILARNMLTTEYRIKFGALGTIEDPSAYDGMLSMMYVVRVPMIEHNIGAQMLKKPDLSDEDKQSLSMAFTKGCELNALRIKNIDAEIAGETVPAKKASTKAAAAPADDDGEREDDAEAPPPPKKSALKKTTPPPVHQETSRHADDDDMAEDDADAGVLASAIKAAGAKKVSLPTGKAAAKEAEDTPTKQARKKAKTADEDDADADVDDKVPDSAREEEKPAEKKRKRTQEEADAESAPVAAVVKKSTAQQQQGVLLRTITQQVEERSEAQTHLLAFVAKAMKKFADPSIPAEKRLGAFHTYKPGDELNKEDPKVRESVLAAAKILTFLGENSFFEDVIDAEADARAKHERELVEARERAAAEKREAAAKAAAAKAAAAKAAAEKAAKEAAEKTAKEAAEKAKKAQLDDADDLLD